MIICWKMFGLISVLLMSSALYHTTAQEDQLSLAVFVSAIDAPGSIIGGAGVGRPFLEAVRLAVELINNSTEILPDYSLDFEVTDSQCQAGSSVRGFIDQIFMERTRIMIVGADCSTSTEPIAELAPFWNLVQISPVSTSPVLSRDSVYSSFLRVVSSDVAVAEGVVELMIYFNWTRVAVISQQENIFSSMFAQLRTDLKRANITSNPREFTFNTDDDPSSVVQRLYNSPTRIIFLNVYPSYGLEVMCQAYRLGMTHQNGYMWMLFAWYPEEWWLDPPVNRTRYTPEECQQSEIEDILEHALLIDHFPYVSEEEKLIPTSSGLDRHTFDAMLQERLSGITADKSLASQAHFYFDAVWAAALTLHNTSTRDGYNLSRFTYDPQEAYSAEIAQTLYNNAKSLDFLGMSGLIKFDEVGDRSPSLRYFQYRRKEINGSRRIVRVDVGSGDTQSLDIIFPFGVPQDERFVYIYLPLFVVYTVLACMGIAFAIVCLIMNILFRDKKVMKLSSPYLNILIVAGIILFYIDVILFGIDEGTPASRCSVNALCMLRLWIASIAFTLVFGTIFAKTWRVYYVFYSSNRHKRSKKTVNQDWVLFLMVGAILVVDVFFLLLVTAFPHSRLTLENVELLSINKDLPDIVGLCRARDRFIWLTILFAYKGILLVIGMFLAFETRKVKIRQLNDSKLIGMSVYGIVVLSIALSVIGILLERYVNEFFAVMGIMIIFGSTSLLCLIFIPKFYGLWKDPNGLKIMGGTTGTSASKSSESKEMVVQLQQEIIKLKQELNRLSVVPKSPLHAVPEEAVFESSMKTISFLEDQDTKAIASLQLATVTQNGIATSEEESV